MVEDSIFKHSLILINTCTILIEEANSEIDRRKRGIDYMYYINIIHILNMFLFNIIIDTSAE